MMGSMNDLSKYICKVERLWCYLCSVSAVVLEGSETNAGKHLPYIVTGFQEFKTKDENGKAYC